MKTLSKCITIVLIMLGTLSFVTVGNVCSENYHERSMRQHNEVVQQQRDSFQRQQELNELRKQTRIMEENQREQKRRNYNWQNPFGN
jgi:hypothetical protein